MMNDLTAKYLINTYLFLSLVFLLHACTESKSDIADATEQTGVEKLRYTEKKSLVDVIVLTQGDFNKEIVSNGKLKALRKSDLKFIANGTLRQLLVKNGQRVDAVQTIARLDEFEYTQKLAEAENALYIAMMELEDLMLARGYALKDSAKMQTESYKMLGVRSGATQAKANLKTATYNLHGAVLKAPFAGKIANLKYNQYEQVGGDVFCTIIDDAEFAVEFHLIEAEIKDVRLHDAVSITPFTNNAQLSGYISEINPVIDEHGLVLVKARVKNVDSQLMEGMNVKVSVKKELHDLLVVPKSAIVLRQNQEVLFKYSLGKALWVYVQTDFENSDSYSVRSHPQKEGTLSAGDTIIISGNLNLANESAVDIRP